MHHTLVALVSDNPGIFNRAASRYRANSALLFIAVASLLGCSSKPAPNVVTITPAGAQQQPQYPARPTVPPPAFKVFHHDASSITLVTKDNATDAEIAAVIWQLRDAAQAHSFDKIGVPQKLVDARDPIVFFHLYRGSKCASEKYTSGALPCGASYHAVGEFTLGGFSNHDRADGSLLHDEQHQTELWNPDAPTNN
jgi:hypothetical protein